VDVEEAIPALPNPRFATAPCLRCLHLALLSALFVAVPNHVSRMVPYR